MSYQLLHTSDLALRQPTSLADRNHLMNRSCLVLPPLIFVETATTSFLEASALSIQARIPTFFLLARQTPICLGDQTGQIVISGARQTVVAVAPDAIGESRLETRAAGSM